MKKFCISIVIVLFSLSVQQTHATVSEDTRFRIEKQTVDVIPYQAPTSTKIQTQQDEPEQEAYAQGKNFIVTTTANKPFSFTMTTRIIDFDKPEATVPILRTSALTIDSPLAFILLGSQDHPLKKGNLILPNTTCDNGSCSETLASLWKSNLTYGAGFRCDSKSGITCPTDFQSEYFRPFSDRSQGKKPQIVMTGRSGTKQMGTITYKIVTAATQQEAAYRNTIQYIAVPEY